MTDRVLAAGAGVGWIAADEAYGDNPELRRELEDRGLSYVMAVSCDTQISVPKGRIRADELAATLPASGWQIRSAGQGSKGERLYAWAYTRLNDTATGDNGDKAESRHHRWLLIRRNPHRRTGLLPVPRHHHCPAGNASAGSRDSLAGRGELPSRQGLRRPGRTPSPHLDLLAPLDHPRHARPRLPRRHRRTSPTATHDSHRQHHTRRHRTPNSDDSPYLQRNQAPRAALTRPIHDRRHIARWSRFRRRHQHRARRCHYQARQERDHDLRLY